MTATDTLTRRPSRTKGPLVWLDMDQQELDDAYDQAVYAPNREQVHHRRHFNSARARAALGEPLRFAYGPSKFEGLDVYCAKGVRNAPGAVYIHGGAWLQRVADNEAHDEGKRR